MAKLSLIFMVGALSCLVEQAYSNGFYYYPDTQGALSYQYLPSYAPYGYAPYAFVAPTAADCDQKEEGESSSSSSESSSEESSSSESKEGKSKEEEEGSSSSEEKEEKEEGEEKKEEGSSSSSSSSSEESGEKGEEKKEEPKKKKTKVEKSLFPPTTYSFPPRPVQQVVYSAPASYPYVPYKAYSVMQAPVSYPVKSSYVSVPISSTYTAPMVKSYVPSQMTRIVSSPISKIMSVPSVSKSYAFNPSSSLLGLSSYWAPSSNLQGYYKA